MAVTVKKSELQSLLEKNAYGAGLTVEETKKAKKLIADPVYTENECWICEEDKAIYDTGICRGHAYYALITRK